MLLLDEVRAAGEATITCGVTVREPCLFMDDHRVRAVIALEYMAQCVGAFAGLKARARGEPVRVGYLVGAREVAFAVDHFDVGDELTVEARHAWGDCELGHFTCAVVRAGRAVATATLNVYQRAPEGP